MKVALIAANGTAGSRILAELVSRGHAVTAVVRQPDKLGDIPGVTIAQGDANQPAAMAEVLAGHDAVISAAKFTHAKGENLIEAVRASGVKRYLVVGGAGSLIGPDGDLEMNHPRFPPHVLPEATEGGRFLELLRAAPDLEWTFLSPSRIFVPGERTGKFRIGTDKLMFGEDGASRISMEDFAVALVDELEHPKHIRERFTVGY